MIISLSYFSLACLSIALLNLKLFFERVNDFSFSGYGEYAGQFFYYGNMNQWAYENKFRVSHSVKREDLNFEENDGRWPVPVTKSNYDLIVTAKVRCSSDLAPLAVRY